MARRRNLSSFEDFKRALKNKYGLGDYKNYTPWLRIQDVSSHGTRSQIFGLKTSRAHHTLSSVETEFFYLAEFSDSVIDIREQFPLLPIDITQQIARAIDIKHPQIPGTDVDNVMTTDFLLTKRTGENISYHAVCVKHEDETNKERVLAKIDIERIFWEQLDVKFSFFTGTPLTKVQSRNIAWATAPLRNGSFFFDENLKSNCVKLIKTGKQITKELCNNFTEYFGVEKSNSLNLLRILIAEKWIDVDLNILLEDAEVIYVKSINHTQVHHNGTL